MGNMIFYILGAIVVFIIIMMTVIRLLARKLLGKTNLREKAQHLYKEEIPANMGGNRNTSQRGKIQQIELSAFLAEPRKNTTGWKRARVYIDSWGGYPLEVVNNGNIEGYLLDFFVRYSDINLSDSIHPIAALNNVRRCYIPKTHLHSFGKYTPVIVLYNPKNPLEIIPDPEHDNWHYEI